MRDSVWLNSRRLVPRFAIPVAALTSLLFAGISLGGSKLELVSRSSGAGGAIANSDSVQPALSANGRVAAFASQATNLVPEDTDDRYDVYVRNLVSGETLLVSRASGLEGAKGDGSSLSPSITANGRYVAFTSDSRNLVPGIAAGVHVFLRDLLSGTTTLVDRASGPAGEVANQTSDQASVSGDGRLVAFTSDATNLDPADTNSHSDVYVRDLLTEETRLVSRTSGAGGTVGIKRSDFPSISADGERVAFRSFSKNLGPEKAMDAGSSGILVRNLTTHKTIFASRASGADGRVRRTSVGPPSISADGRRVAFDSFGDHMSPRDRERTDDVYVRDIESNRTLYASRDLKPSGGREPGSATEARISADGRLVAFAVFFVEPGRFYFDQAFTRDLESRRSRLVAGAITGRSPGTSLHPVLSGDGRTLAFQSSAGNLVQRTSQRPLEVFVQKLSSSR